MAHDLDLVTQEPGSLSRNGLYHCKVGRETVHDIVTKATDIFDQLKRTNPAPQNVLEQEAKRVKIREMLSATKYKFDTLRRHHNAINEIGSSLAYVQVKSLIPFKDDPDNVEQIQKHRRNLCADPDPETAKEKEELTKKIAEVDDQLQRVTNDLRDFIYEINTMLHIGKS